MVFNQTILCPLDAFAVLVAAHRCEFRSPRTSSRSWQMTRRSNEDAGCRCRGSIVLEETSIIVAGWGGSWVLAGAIQAPSSKGKPWLRCRSFNWNHGEHHRPVEHFLQARHAHIEGQVK